MIRRLLDRCTYRQVNGLDIDLAAVGDDSYLLIHTGRRWWKRVVEVRVDRDELALLGEMIRDAETGTIGSAGPSASSRGS